MREDSRAKEANSLLVRPVRGDDREAILAIVHQTPNFSESDVLIAQELVDEALCLPEKNDYRILCAVSHDHSLVGYICFGPIPLTTRCFDLYWIAVDSGWSRKGVGKQLLVAMEDALVGEGARHVYIETSSTSPYAAARAFYKKHGYEVACVLKDFYRKGDHKVIYVKDLS